MKDLRLNEIINIRASYEKMVKKRLLEMTCFFQEKMWDGYSDENDPKFLTQEEFEMLEALTNKMEHMLLNIGCPLSVEEMLHSIVSRKIKYWQAESCIYTNIEEQGFTKGKQLKSSGDLKKLKDYTQYTIAVRKETYDGGILKGHFRWNNRGYMLSRRANDALEEYLCYKF